MKNQAFNPYLPGWEYIPDGEPHLFDGRVYVYGSHDHFDSPIFCVGDYICWSAPEDDLSDWRYEGVIYKKNQDPRNRGGHRLLFAPDVCRGTDGRYYLFYAFDFMGIIGVAVSERPAGPYEFYGHVHYADGTLWGRRKGDQFPFDPGVLVDDDGSVYLYSGFHTPVPAIVTGGRKLRNDGGVVCRLEPDMLTLKEDPKLLFPVKGEGSFPGHEFFEASSIRKDGDKYIFVYSSVNNHELCYAVSDRPDRGFTYGGTLVDQGDLYLPTPDCPEGNTDESKAVNYLGNTHGGLLNLGEDWYIFYHRQTNRHSYSRQACAEKLKHPAVGVFRQAEVTSCGLNGGPFTRKGTYPARIACILQSEDGVGRYDSPKPRKAYALHPFFYQRGKDVSAEEIRVGAKEPEQYIANMRNGALCGFRYFDVKSVHRLTVDIAGSAIGTLTVSADAERKQILAEFPVHLHHQRCDMIAENFNMPKGVTPLYFCFEGDGVLDFYGFTLG